LTMQVIEELIKLAKNLDGAESNGECRMTNDE
jgi:hypothetical protein